MDFDFVCLFTFALTMSASNRCQNCRPSRHHKYEKKRDDPSPKSDKDE